MTRRSTRLLLPVWLVPFLVATSVAWAVSLMTPGRAFACSCVSPEPMRAYAGHSDRVIFSGTIAPASGQDVVVLVDRWFQGGSGLTVALDGSGFGNQSAACQVPRPAAGSRWLYVAFVPVVGAPPQVNQCTPQAALDSADGQAMLADAIATFGGGGAPTPSSAPPAGAVTTPAPSTPGAAAPIGVATERTVPVMTLAVVIVLGGIAVVVAAWLIARSRARRA